MYNIHSYLLLKLLQDLLANKLQAFKLLSRVPYANKNLIDHVQQHVDILFVIRVFRNVYNYNTNVLSAVCT